MLQFTSDILLFVLHLFVLSFSFLLLLLCLAVGYLNIVLGFHLHLFIIILSILFCIVSLAVCSRHYVHIYNLSQLLVSVFYPSLWSPDTLFSLRSLYFPRFLHMTFLNIPTACTESHIRWGYQFCCNLQIGFKKLMICRILDYICLNFHPLQWFPFFSEVQHLLSFPFSLENFLQLHVKVTGHKSS